MSEIDLRHLAGERFERELAAAWQAKDFPKALALSVELLALREEALGPTDPAVINVLCDLAELHRRLGNPSEGERLLTRALAAEEARGASERQGRVAFQLAQIWLECGETARALPLLERAATMAGVAEQVVAFGSLATVVRELGRTAEARAFAEQALSACDPKRTPPLDAAQAHTLMAEICEEAGELEHAHALFVAAHDLYVLALGDAHPQVGIALLNVVAVAQRRGHEVEDAARRVLAILRESIGPDHEKTREVQRMLEALLGAKVAEW
jgi:tetratricopeptide (TPR) repeat protein